MLWARQGDHRHPVAVSDCMDVCERLRADQVPGRLEEELRPSEFGPETDLVQLDAPPGLDHPCDALGHERLDQFRDPRLRVKRIEPALAARSRRPVVAAETDRLCRRAVGGPGLG